MVGSKSERNNGDTSKTRQASVMAEGRSTRVALHSVKEAIPVAHRAPDLGHTRAGIRAGQRNALPPHKWTLLPQAEQSMGWSLGTEPQQVQKDRVNRSCREPPWVTALSHTVPSRPSFPGSLPCQAEAAQLVFTSAQVCSVVSCFPEQGPGRRPPPPKTPD